MILLNTYRESRRKTPLAVSLRSTEREFGEMALQQSIKNPKTAYLYITQILAKSLDNPVVQAYREKYPFYDIREDPVTKTIYFQHDEYDFSILACLIRYLWIKHYSISTDRRHIHPKSSWLWFLTMHENLPLILEVS